MRKLLIAGLAVASITGGIAYAQVDNRTEAEIINALLQRSRADRKGEGPTCVDPDGVTRKLEETVTIGKLTRDRTAVFEFQFRCVETYGERVKSNGANWIQISPDSTSIRYFNP